MLDLYNKPPKVFLNLKILFTYIVNIVLTKSLKRIIDLITKFHLRLQTQRIEPVPFTSAAIWRFQLRLMSMSRHKMLTWFFATSIFCSNISLMIFIVSIITTYFLSISSRQTPVLCLYLWLYIKKNSFRILLGGKTGL